MPSTSQLLSIDPDRWQQGHPYFREPLVSDLGVGQIQKAKFAQVLEGRQSLVSYLRISQAKHRQILHAAYIGHARVT